MYIYIFTIIIILLTIAVYKCIVKPKREMNWYIRQIEKKGYKLHVTPFKPFGISRYDTLVEDLKKGDAFKAQKQNTEYDLCIFNALNVIILQFIHPQLLQDLFSSEKLGVCPKVEFFYKHIERAMGTGVVFSEGNVWKRKRRIITTVFNFQFLKSLTHRIAKISDHSISRLEEETKKNGKFKNNEEYEYNLFHLTVNMFSTVMVECFFGDKVADQKLDNELLPMFVIKLIDDISMQGKDILYVIFGSKFINLNLRKSDKDVNRRIQMFKNWALQVVRKRIKETKQKFKNSAIENQQPSDLIEALVMGGKISNVQSQQEYSELQIFQEFCTFFIVGTDTTSHYLEMMIYYIALNPQVQKKLREQVQKYMGEDDYSYANLKNFKYIERIQNQTTRLYGPVNGVFPRITDKDFYVKDIPVKKGTSLFYSAITNHYSEKYFKDPKKFEPERWEKDCNDIPTHAFIGFGGGMRTCIGKHLALLESKIALIKIIKRYKKVVLPKSEIRMEIKSQYTPEHFETKFTISSQNMM